MRNGTHVGSLLPERAPSEGPRSTAAVEPNMGVVPRGKTSKLGRTIYMALVGRAQVRSASSSRAEIVP